MANLKNTEIDSNEYLGMPKGSTNQRPNSPQAGMLRFNTDLDQIEFFTGSNWLLMSQPWPLATGGQVIDASIKGTNYRFHLFSNPGSETITFSESGYVDVLIVGGGGGGGSGGSNYGGGGGAGGVVFIENYYVDQGSYAVTVGAGGAGAATSSGADAESGEDSSVFGLTAIGGGFGGNQRTGNVGNGGSGGGGAYNDPGGLGLQPGSASGGLGNDGNSGNAGPNRAGGGGGAGSGGINSRHGGEGIYLGHSFTDFVGDNGWFAGGGGGVGWRDFGLIGLGGLGGGGQGTFWNGGTAPLPTPGYRGTGGGGGGASTSSNTGEGRPGGSGIVIIAYKKSIINENSPDRVVSSQFSTGAKDVKEDRILDLDASNPVSFQPGSSTWFDLSNHNNGTATNLEYSDELGGIVTFSTQNQSSVEVASNSEIDITGELTLEIMLKINSLPVQGSSGRGFPLICKGAGSNQSYELAIHTSNLSVIKTEEANSGADYRQDSATQLEIGKWYHIIYVSDLTTGKFFINGEQDSSVDDTSTFVRGSGTGPLRIGNGISGGLNSGSTHADGSIPLIRIYRRALSDEEIKQNFRSVRKRFGNKWQT